MSSAKKIKEHFNSQELIGHFDPDSVRQLSWLKRSQAFREQGYTSQELEYLFVVQTLFHTERTKKSTYLITKQVFDSAWALLGIVILLPMFAVVAALIKASSPGPVLFKQLRAGADGRVFLIWKFRTMKQWSEFDKNHSPVIPLQKVRRDQRTTSIGRLLRKWKIDELPQLVNVLLGDMSLVGPRPLPLEESATCPIEYFMRFAAKPGLTGLWQATCPNTVPAETKFRLDAEYVKKRSLAFDLYLLIRTIPMLIRGEQNL